MLIPSFKLTVEVAKTFGCAGVALDASVIFRLGKVVNIAVEDRKVHPCPCSIHTIIASMCDESVDCPGIKVCGCRIYTNHKIAEVRPCEPFNQILLGV